MVRIPRATSSSPVTSSPNITLTCTGDGSYAFGQVWRDTLHIGNLTVANATIEDAQYVSPSIIWDQAMSWRFRTGHRLAQRGVSPAADHPGQASPSP